MSHIDVMKQALDGFIKIEKLSGMSASVAVIALRNAIKDAEKIEPVGIVNPAYGGVEWLIDWSETPLPDDTPLYTHPPFSPDWNAINLLSEANFALHKRIAELEQKLKEKNHIADAGKKAGDNT